VGRPPDPRAVAAARRRGIELSSLRARQVTALDFETFDYLIAMDRENLADLRAASPPHRAGRLRLLLAFTAAGSGSDVPDPFYGGADGFDAVFDLIEDGARGVMEHIRDRHFAAGGRRR
jgi:protein-tyrosine phosphatase